MNGSATSSDELAAVLNEIASAGSCCGNRSGLLRWMSERAPLYQGKSTSEVERLRAFIAVKLAQRGLADALVAYALEELETGTNAFSVAAAARIIRLASTRPAGTAALVAGAIARIRGVNEFVQFDCYPGSPGMASVSAVEEAEKTLLGLQSGGSAGQGCCSGRAQAAPEPDPVAGSIEGLHDLELQNQSGECAKFGDIFAGRASLIAFFYTRCMNPDKCSRTVSQLGEVQRLIPDGDGGPDVMIGGITYDPAYDLPERLYRYGAERGLAFGRQCQLLRSTGPFDAIRERLNLGVGYGSSTVNRHRIELILADAKGVVVHSSVRRLWDSRAIAERLLAAAHR